MTRSLVACACTVKGARRATVLIAHETCLESTAGNQFQVTISRAQNQMCDWCLRFGALTSRMCSINSWSGQTIANCWSRSQLGMPCTGLRFNKPPGIRPCPLYTPPVALTDGLLCEFEGLDLAPFGARTMETQTNSVV